MPVRAHRSAPIVFVFALAAAPLCGAQVFVVGEKTATAEVKTDFTPTDLQLPKDRLNERDRRELVRMLEAEQGFAHRALPMGAGVTLRANGPISPSPEQYRRMVYEKGESAAPGDRVIITAMNIGKDRIVFDLNGGPYAKHRFLSHIQLNDNPVVATNVDKPVGARVTLTFDGPVPDLSPPEVKALLAPVIDFGAKTGEQAYAETLPPFLKDAIASHDVLVGMNRRMVLAALGAPESKLRENAGEDGSGAHYEEWIYGHVPQTVQFVRFQGDVVEQVKVAALGKPIVVHDRNEMQGYAPPGLTREIALGDRKPADGSAAAPSSPTLLQPGEAPDPAAVSNGQRKVQIPTAKAPAASSAPNTGPGTP